MKNKKIIVTGATGNIGMPVLKYLKELGCVHIVACEHNIEKASEKLSHMGNIEVRRLDFEQPPTFSSALEDGEVLFLLRPPQISDAEKFRPFLEQAQKQGIKGVVFLSVQGADKQSFIPHAKIEKLIKGIGLPYIFLRPGYFMQNFTTTLIEDVKEGTIILPAGNAPFMWTDAENIGEIAAHVLLDFNSFSNTAIEITGKELLSFNQAVKKINNSIASDLKYQSVNLIRFWRHRKRQGTQNVMIAVMIMLHYLPRLQKPPEISTAYNDITGKEPTTLEQFAVREKEKLLQRLSGI